MCFLSVNFGPQGAPGGAPGDSWAPAVGYCVLFSSVNLGPQGAPRGILGSSCQVLCVFYVCQFRASGDPWGTPGDSWAPAVKYCVLFSSDSEGRTENSSQQHHLEAGGNKHRPRARTMNRKLKICAHLHSSSDDCIGERSVISSSTGGVEGQKVYP